jgi:CBS domain containing-hemolysin-like protein
MFIFYISIFVLLVFFSGFFSSAETSLLSLNKIKLNLKAKKKDKKAELLTKILEEPEEFFATILIGNNFVNIAAASISTVLFTRLIVDNEELSLLVSTVVTTIIILMFSEIIPKSYAFRHNEKLSRIYAYPIRFFWFSFFPFVKVTTALSRMLFESKEPHVEEKGLTIEEIKHFLSSQKTLVRYHPESLRMVNEIIDIAEKDIKSIMTPRLDMIAIEENADMEALRALILARDASKIPVYRENLDNITGIIHAADIMMHLFDKDFRELKIKSLQRPPIFISEYSSLNYALQQFKKHSQKIAVIIDEYGATIGLLTLNDIFSEILGEIRIERNPIRKIRKNVFNIQGNMSVDEVNEQLNLNLPEKVDYTTMSGLFIYHFGKFPAEKSKVRLEDGLLVVKRMGKRKIEELLLIKDDTPGAL